jgi:uncharacterized phiE125 gp8 family phage protein/SPP1 family predicted phage head-tail adaptor
MNYSLVESTAPTAEPITVYDAKCQSRIDETADDLLIQAYITAARRYLERIMCRSFVTTSWTMTMDDFPRVIRPPRSPLISVTSIKYFDGDGNQQTLATSVYKVDALTEPGRIVEAEGQSWPSVQNEINTVEVIFKAGYGLAAAVPETVKQAIRLLVGLWYENREAASEKPSSELPRAVKELMWADRVLVMRAGALRHRIRIQNHTETQDSVGQVTRTWATCGIKWAKVEPLSVNERLRAQQIDAKISHKITLRWFENFNPDQRILFKDRYFYIKGSIKRDEINNEMIIMAEENVGDAG